MKANYRIFRARLSNDLSERAAYVDQSAIRWNAVYTGNRTIIGNSSAEWQWHDEHHGRRWWDVRGKL